MKRKTSATAGKPEQEPPVSQTFTGSRYYLVMGSVLAAIAAYWFLFIIGGTFDPAKRAALKRTVSNQKKLLSTSKAKSPRQSTGFLAPKSDIPNANLQAGPASTIKGSVTPKHTSVIRQ